MGSLLAARRDFYTDRQGTSPSCIYLLRVMVAVAPRVARRATTDTVVRAVALVMALLPVVAVLVTRVGRPYFPMQDPASIDLFVRDVFTSHTPLVGAYSRGFNHPGPSLFYVLAPLSELTGGATWATLVGAALVQGVAIVSIGLLAARLGGTRLMLLMLAVLALVYAGLDDARPFTDAWNPYAALPWFLVFLLCVWGVARGDRWLAVGAVGTASFVVESHVGYAPLVLVALYWAAAVVMVDRPARDGAPRWPRILVWSAVVLAVLWLPPVIEQVRDRPGNLSALWTYFTSGGTTLGLRGAAGLFAVEFRWVPPWLGGHDPRQFATGSAGRASEWWLLGAVALIAAGWWAARRSGRRADQRLVELVGLLSAVGVFTLSRLTVESLPYVFYWRITLAVVVVAASGWAITHALPAAWSPWIRRAGLGTCGVAILVGFGAQVVRVIDRRHYLAPVERESAAAWAEVSAAGIPEHPVLVPRSGAPWAGSTRGSSTPSTAPARR